MRKFMGLLILAALGFAVYTFSTDKNLREKVFNTLEESTGFTLDMMTGHNVTNAMDAFISDLGNRNKRFQQSLDVWGKDFLNKLNNRQFHQLKRELKREIDKGGDNLDKILDKYLSKVEINSL